MRSGHPVVTYAAMISPPTEEFSGGVDLQPMTRRFEACMAPTFFAGGCSFPPADPPAEVSDVQLRESVEELFPYLSWVSYQHSWSMWEEVEVAGCGVPPFGILPDFLLLACLMGYLAVLVCFGIAGVAPGFVGGMKMNNEDNSVTEDPVMCIGATCICSGVDHLSPESRQQVRAAAVCCSCVFAAADRGGGGTTAVTPNGDSDPEHGGVLTWGVP
ncbi:hypothetical protein CYMTET_14594 [Cymbomonas tetramitiformis]|uniref:Uncharacterized protein n=1 Tax=Cymbomonas tetramitiformis TaxID=36881 RepID=A0AAE0LA79_9CHLO|nr:hypothetical protein CYMTET_14594 [Cymbomonas tetramitiformis]